VIEQEIEIKGGRAIAIGVDVSDAQSVKIMINKAVQEYKVLDFAVNNAGIMGACSTIAECTEDNWARVIGVNLTGVFHCMKYELLEMQKHRQGAIVNMSSIAGLVGLDAKLPGYAASKHGVLGLTKTAALENASFGIRVNAVCPGEIDTAMQKEYESLLREHTGQSPEIMAVGRKGMAEEVAEAVLWLCLDRIFICEWTCARSR